MTPDTVLMVERIVEFCHARWEDADRPAPSGFPTEDMQTGRKMAYNDVLQFARKLMAEGANKP